MKLRSVVGRRAAGLAVLGLSGVIVVMMAAAPAGAATTTNPCPAGAPVLQLANPNPGDVLSQGDYIISGTAFDPASSDGAGVDRVDIFLGDRDSGGVLLASATPSQRVFEVKATLPSTANGGREVVAYAYSSLTGQQTIESVPVFIGAAPTPTPTGTNAPAPAPLTSTTTSTCSGTSAAAAASAPAPVAVTLPVTAPAPAASQPSAMASGPVLDLGNPNPGDLLSTGDFIVSGETYDPAATAGGVGVDHVDLFLDSRESGGIPLGSGDVAGNGTFEIRATLPSTANGGHSIVAYAHSTVTDQETVVSVPVYIGAAPTPTPRPRS